MALKIKLGLFALVVMIPLFFWMGCKGEVDTLGIKLKLETQTLSNGLQIILVPNPEVPIVSYQTWVKVGSVDEKWGATGLAHFFEHLMFKGTAKYGPKEFFNQLEAKGAEVNAFTMRDYTVFHETFTPDLLDRVIEMESDRLVNLKIDQDVLNTERQVVLEERRLRTENSPSGKMHEAVWEQAYRVHPYRNPVIGYPDDLMRMTVESITAFYKAYYHPSNVVVIVVGNFDRDKTLEKLKKFYSPIPGKLRPTREVATEPEQSEERRLVLYDAIASDRFMMGYHVTSAIEDDTYAIDVLANILFEGTSSRAYSKLVEENPMALGIGGSAYTPTYPGLFTIAGALRGKIPAEKIEIEIEKLIKDVQEHGVTDDEVKKAVRQLTVQMVDSVRTAHGMGQLIGTVTMIFSDPERFAKDVTKYLQVTKADVQRVAKKYLIPNNRTVVIMRPNPGGSANKEVKE